MHLPRIFDIDLSNEKSRIASGLEAIPLAVKSSQKASLRLAQTLFSASYS